MNSYEFLVPWNFIIFTVAKEKVQKYIYSNTNSIQLLTQISKLIY